MTDEDWKNIVHVELDEESIKELEQRAETMDFILEEYCGVILAQWLRSDQPDVLTAD